MIGIIAGVAIVVATVFPWYTAQTTHGHATMNGLGIWTIEGNLGASLRPLPFGVLIWLVAGAMIYCAARAMFGGTVVCAMGCFAIGLAAVLGTSLADRHIPGSDSVAIALAQASRLSVGIGLLASVVCWIGFARCVLRPAPKAEAQP
ncbi:hypothetical protein ABIA30_000836 [Mycobacterium sp. MAA66]|uniref:hypothetical protein n=1 Tax=Mycobacterium sp. MAA66 TaxID=3156297 RepID=UPI00351379B9